MNAWAINVCRDSDISDEHLHDMLKNPTIFRQALAMNYDSTKGNEPKYIGNIDRIWKENFTPYNFPQVESVSGMSDVIDITLINFYTNVSNHLINDIAFDQIQKQYIMDFLSCYMSKKEARKCFWP